MATAAADPTPTISVESWEMDRLMAIPLSRCAACQRADLLRLPAYTASGRLWLEAECPECGHTVTLPGGRQRERARSHDVIPTGVPAWFRAHRNADARERAAGASSSR